MSYYAHAEFETEGQRYRRGDSVPADLEGLDELLEGGAVSEDEYDPAVDVVPMPDTVEIDGVVYKKAGDSAGEEATANAL